MRYCFLLLFLIITQNAFANISSDLTHYFDKLGLENNVDLNAYHGQQAGFYTGGNVFGANAGRETQMTHLNLPSYRSGCTGIDLFTGGFSFINADELISLMKNILNNAKGYAFNLALESVTPEIANTLKYVQTLENTINQANIHSCETSAGLVGSFWPKTQIAQQQICADIGAGQGLFDDWAAARQACGAGGQMSKTFAEAQGAYKNLVIDQGNIAWQAIQKNPFLQNDRELAELFLSLSGSMIIRKQSNAEDAKVEVTLLPSLATDKNLLKGLLQGGVIEIYQCDDPAPNACLNPHKIQLTIATNDSLQGHVIQLLNNFVSKITHDKKLTPAEIALIQATSLPIYKILHIQSAFAEDLSALNITHYAEMIASDILFQYLLDSFKLIRTSSQTLPYPSALMDAFSETLEKTHIDVQNQQRNAYSQMTLSSHLTQQAQTLEHVLVKKLSNQLSSNLLSTQGGQK